MKYSELITFQPIESVIQLRDANRKESARKLVASYVISNEMCQRLSEVVIPHLQYEKPHDNKGILIVGNYGTGKSHMLSVLSTVAENADVLPLLTNPTVREAAAGIAGKFQVIRLEIGATQMALQDIITTALEKSLADWGVSFRFPDATQHDLDADPKCPHCGFWPSMEDIKVSAEAILDALKSDLGKIQKSWTQSLLDNLGDPVVQGNFGLLKPKQRKMIEDVIKDKELPDEITNDFLQALKEVLSDLAKVPIRLNDLKAALFPDGSPTTPAEFKNRFEYFVSGLLKGKDAGKTRIVLE